MIICQFVWVEQKYRYLVMYEVASKHITTKLSPDDGIKALEHDKDVEK